MQGVGKRFVYVLRSETHPERHYVGVTTDVDSRLDWHNFGPVGQTRMNRAWTFVVVLEVANEATALRFERYLQIGSGRAFAKKHLCPDPVAETVPQVWPLRDRLSGSLRRSNRVSLAIGAVAKANSLRRLSDRRTRSAAEPQRAEAARPLP